MTTANKLESAQAVLLEVTATVEQELARARFALIEAADENRRLSSESAHVNLKVYTEEEAAAELKMSAKTLARLRARFGAAWPYFREGIKVRYTNTHLIEITQLLDNRKARKTSARRA